MKLVELVRNAKFAIPLALGLWGSSASMAQTADQVRINGTVRDTSGHVVENVNVKIWKSDNPNILELTETDFLGQYQKDLATPVEDIPYEQQPLTIINNGNSRHVGFVGTLPQRPQHVNIINSIGQIVDQISFDYDPASQHFQADWKADKPGVYFAQINLPQKREVLKFVASGSDIPPVLGYGQASHMQPQLKSADATKNGEQIKYYIELTSDGNEPIQFQTQKDSVFANPGQIVYPEHIITPIIPNYSAIINGQVTLEGLHVGPNFRVMLTPEQGSIQELFTDENGSFTTTISIPPESFPYGPATIHLTANTNPTAQSIQTTNAEQTINITNATLPYNLELAVDSAHVNLAGNLGTGVSGTILVNGKTIATGNLPEQYTFNDIKTIQQENNVHYELEKYHHQPINHNANVNVWNTYTFNPTFTFIPAEYTATITGDAGANITITKVEGEETLWNLVSTGTNNLPVVERNELDSIQVHLTAELAGKIEYDTTFYLRENVPQFAPNNITFVMQDRIAEYTATITGDENANVTIKKADNQETLWNYTSTGTNNLPIIQRNDLDSILVELTAQLAGKIDYDTTFYLKENLPQYQPNNITFVMQDEEIPQLYGRAFGIMRREDYLALANAHIKFLMSADTILQFSQQADPSGVYDISNLPTDADGETYIVRITPTTTSPSFLPYETTTTIYENNNRRDFTDIRSVPQHTTFTISTYNEKDSVALSNVLVSYYLNGPDGIPQTPDDILFAQTTSTTGNATITDVPAGSNGYFEAQMTGANADDYFKYSRARFSTPPTITTPADTLANVLFLMVEQEQTIPGTQGQASMVLDDAYQVRSRQGGKSNPWSIRGQPYKLSTAQLVNDAYGTVAEKIAQLQRVIHETDSMLYDGRQTIILTDETHPAIIGTGARADPYTEAGQQALDSLGFYATVGENYTETDQKVLSYYGLNGFDIKNGQTIIVDGETKLEYYLDNSVRKEIYFRLRGRGHPNGVLDDITRTTEHLIDRMEQKTYNAFYNHNTTSYTARHLYTNDE